jgi:hypothetical protein
MSLRPRQHFRLQINAAVLGLLFGFAALSRLISLETLYEGVLP